MLFNSFSYLIFLPIVVALYHALPQRFRWIMLLAASCLFYMAFVPKYILILIVTILIDYVAGIQIEKTSGTKKKVYLVISIISTCLVLFVFKYINFFINSVNDVMAMLNRTAPFEPLKILLPIGLSFHTFQSLGYVVEVYEGKQKAERHLGIYSLYVMFFPQLVAGPIERPAALLPQLYGDRHITWDSFYRGLRLIAWGLFKKMVIADRLATYVDLVYKDPHAHAGPTLYLATVFFAFQIYCDFSGYSDIAIGSAQFLGINLMRNFRSPYLGTSIIEFWTRWHISLTSWFRDYLYIPLGGNREGRWRELRNIFIVFCVSGLWHGASWTFVAWGVYHGLLFIATRLWVGKHGGIHRSGHPLAALGGMILTFHLALIGWVFFRAATIHDAFYVLSHMLTRGPVSLSFGELFDVSDLGVAVLALLAMLAVELTEQTPKLKNAYDNAPIIFRWALYYALFFAVAVFADVGSKQFIYFQF